MRPTEERGYAKLAGRLGFEPIGNYAEGLVDGVAVSFSDVNTAHGPCVCMRVAFDRTLDLLLSIELGEGAGSRTAAPQPTGDPDLDGWLVVSGRGEIARAVALLVPEVRTRLRDLTNPLSPDRAVRVSIGDFALEVCLLASLSTDAQASLLRVAIALWDALTRATRWVPVANVFSPSLAAFAHFAQDLRIEVTTCPFGLRGEVDGCAIDIFRFLPGGPKGDVMLIRVGFPAPLPADIILNSHLGAGFWARARSVLEALHAFGPRPGWFSFGKRFRVSRGAPAAIRRAFAVGGALHRLAAAESTSFLNVSTTHLITGVRIKDPHAPPDLLPRIRGLVDLARAVHAASGGERSRRGGPYR